MCGITYSLVLHCHRWLKKLQVRPESFELMRSSEQSITRIRREEPSEPEND